MAWPDRTQLTDLPMRFCYEPVADIWVAVAKPETNAGVYCPAWPNEVSVWRENHPDGNCRGGTRAHTNIIRQGRVYMILVVVWRPGIRRLGKNKVA